MLYRYFEILTILNADVIEASIKNILPSITPCDVQSGVDEMHLHPTTYSCNRSKWTVNSVYKLNAIRFKFKQRNKKKIVM